MKSIESGPIPLAIEPPQTITQRTTTSIEEILAASSEDLDNIRNLKEKVVSDPRADNFTHIINATAHQIAAIRKEDDPYIIYSKPKRKIRY